MKSRGVVLVVSLLTVLAGCAGSGVHPTVSWKEPPAAVAPVRAPANVGPRSFTVIGSGDVLLHDGLWAQAQRDAGDAGGYDFRPLFAAVKPLVEKADLAICHLETPLGPADGPFHNYPIFSVPPPVVPELAELGYDSCSTASNHSLDQGEAGVVRTLEALDAAGIHHAGTARSAVEAQTPTLLTVNRVVVAHLSYTWSFNGLRRPDGEEWLANLLDVDEIEYQARLARLAGAEVVIVSLHAGTEYQHSADAFQRTVAHRLLESPDVDLILGAHVHVVQPLERVNDKWVAYGMGNQVAWQNQAYDTRDGIMPRFTFTEVSPGQFRVTRAEVIPIHMWLDGAPARLYDVTAALADPATSPAIRASCLASLRRTRAVIDELGALEDGLEFVGADQL
jgi:poly-gamma-glutamate capsule biosynthesis protein CapA/YwtB (metallophosphatase superfamily)